MTWKEHAVKTAQGIQFTLEIGLGLQGQMAPHILMLMILAMRGMITLPDCPDEYAVEAIKLVVDSTWGKQENVTFLLLKRLSEQ